MTGPTPHEKSAKLNKSVMLMICASGARSRSGRLLPWSLAGRPPGSFRHYGVATCIVLPQQESTPGFGSAIESAKTDLVYLVANSLATLSLGSSRLGILHWPLQGEEICSWFHLDLRQDIDDHRAIVPPGTNRNHPLGIHDPWIRNPRRVWQAGSPSVDPDLDLVSHQTWGVTAPTLVQGRWPASVHARAEGRRAAEGLQRAA